MSGHGVAAPVAVSFYGLLGTACPRLSVHCFFGQEQLRGCGWCPNASWLLYGRLHPLFCKLSSVMALGSAEALPVLVFMGTIVP